MDDVRGSESAGSMLITELVGGAVPEVCITVVDWDNVQVIVIR